MNLYNSIKVQREGRINNPTLSFLVTLIPITPTFIEIATYSNYLFDRRSYIYFNSFNKYSQ